MICAVAKIATAGNRPWHSEPQARRSPRADEMCIFLPGGSPTGDVVHRPGVLDPKRRCHDGSVASELPYCKTDLSLDPLSLEQVPAEQVAVAGPVGVREEHDQGGGALLREGFPPTITGQRGPLLPGDSLEKLNRFWELVLGERSGWRSGS